MSHTWDVRQLQLGEEKKIVSLLESVFNKWPIYDINCSTFDYWKWKYQNVYHLHSVAVNKDEEVIGCIHLIPSKIKIGERVLQCFNGTDMCVREDYRGQGISKKLREFRSKTAIQNGYEYGSWDSFHPRVIKPSSKYSIFPFSFNNQVRIQDVDLHFQKTSILKKTGFKLLKHLNNNKYALRKNENIFDIIKINEFSSKINVLWENIKNYHNFIVERKQDYLNWRYCDKRGGNYIVKTAVDGDRILGYCVSKINKKDHDYPTGFIVDLITLPGADYVAKRLLMDSIAFFDDNEINMISYMFVNSHPYQALFGRFGFVKTRNQMHRFYQSFNNSRIDLSKFVNKGTEKIHCVYGDTDLI